MVGWTVRAHMRLGSPSDRPVLSQSCSVASSDTSDGQVPDMRRLTQPTAKWTELQCEVTAAAELCSTDASLHPLPVARVSSSEHEQVPPLLLGGAKLQGVQATKADPHHSSHIEQPASDHQNTQLCPPEVLRKPGSEGSQSIKRHGQNPWVSPSPRAAARGILPTERLEA